VRPSRLFLVATGAGANEPGLREGPEAIVSAIPSGRRPAIERIVLPIEPDLSTDDHDDYARRHHLAEARALADVLAPRLAESLERGERPIVLGGDHTVAIGSFSGVRRSLGSRARVGIVWVDAHPDLNTPRTTPSNHGHGMPLSALLGLGHQLLVNAGGIRGAKLATEDVALIGIRSIDPGEADLIARHPEMQVLLPSTIHERGVGEALQPVLDWAAKLDALHLSFDLDAVDPSEAPGVTTPVRGGITRQDALAIVEALNGSGRLVASDVVEYLPRRDREGRTARLAADIVDALGDR
jgi:arginase